MNKLKGIILAGILALTLGAGSGPGPAFAEPTYRQMFSETEGAVLDFAIASAVEPGYFRDMINGRNSVGVQMPIVYVTPYLDLDWGYVAGYEEKQRGSIMIGGTLRVNKPLEDFFGGNVSLVRKTVPVLDRLWDRLWVGPFVAHNFTESELFAGIKAGLSF